MTVWPMICALLLIACGLLAAMDIVVKKLAQAEQVIAKLLPYQGWIGLISCALGLWNFIWSLVSLRHARLFKAMGGDTWIWWISWLLGSLLLMGIGFLLGFPLIRKLFGGKGEEAQVASVAPVADVAAPAETAPAEEAAPVEATTAEATPAEGQTAEVAAAPEPPDEPAPAPPPAGMEDAGEALYAKLSALRTPLGLASIGLGLWLFVACLIWMPPSFIFVGILLSIGLLAGGAIAAAGFLVSRKPDAQAALDKLGAYQDKIGATLLVFGVIALLNTIFVVGKISDLSKGLKNAPRAARDAFGTSAGGVWVYWVTMLLGSLLAVVLGFMLGWPLIKKYLGKTEGEGEDLRAKLTKLQVPLGLAGLVLGLWTFICTLVWGPVHPIALALASSARFSM